MWLSVIVFELVGHVVPHAPAAVTIHSTNSPYTESTLAGPDGRFRFRRVEAGSYTLIAFVPGRGETRLTINVGPGTADRKRRVNVEMRMEGEAINREPANMVSQKELAVPRQARRLYADAEKHLARRDVKSATEALEKAVALAPRFAAAWNHLGTIAYQTQRYPEAEGYFRKGLEADGSAYEPLVNLGGVLINLGNLDEAWSVNVRAVLERPTDPLAQAQLGMTYLQLNKLDLAEKHLLEARRLDAAHFSQPQLHLAELYLRRNDRTRAAAQLEDFLRHHPDYPKAAAIRQALSKWQLP